LAKRFAAFPAANAELVRQGARELGISLPGASAQSMGVVLTALADGLALMKLIDPASVPDELFGDIASTLLAPR
jgi:hypothetical protein